VRSERYKIGMPLSSSLENDLRYIANQDFGLGRKSRLRSSPQSARPMHERAAFRLPTRERNLEPSQAEDGLNRLQHM